MLPLAKTVLTTSSSVGAGMIITRILSPFVKNASGLAKVLMWLGSMGIGIAVSSQVTKAVGIQFDETVDAVKEARNHIEIED